MIAIGGGLESVFKLSVIMNMIDNLTTPMVRVTSAVDSSASKIQNLGVKFGDYAKAGAAIAAVGEQITDAALKPVEATFASQKALGELSSLGIKDLGTLNQAATDFSDKWAGTSKSDFITAAYDIKSGISSLSDKGVADYTTLAGETAKATKDTIADMTSLFATGYGIYKDYYSKMSDTDFGKMFSAGISTAVQKFKTTGSGMSESIRTLGASATTAKVPLEEQLSVLGMLQATMSGSEAGTKYKAFLRTAASGGKALGLSFTDANNQLLSMPEILAKLRGKFGDTMDAAEKMQLQKAFGDTEAVSLIDQMYSKTGSLQNNIVGMYGALGQGTKATQDMASAINNTKPDQIEVTQQQIHNLEETLGSTMLPTIGELMEKARDVLKVVTDWAQKNPALVKGLLSAALAIGGFLTIGGSMVAVLGGIGLITTKTVGFFGSFGTALLKLPDKLTDIRIMTMLAGDKIKDFGGFLKTGLGAVKDFGGGLLNMARQGIASAVEALPGLISSVWSFTAALFANPVTWIVIGIIALVAVIILLKTHWSQVTAWLQSTWNGFVNNIVSGFNTVKSWFTGLPGWAQIAMAVFLPFIGIPLLIITHWDQIKAFFANLWNGISDGAKDAVNFVIGALDALHFTIPSWVPGIGGSSFGFNIPKLAEGGVVNSATSFIAGEHGKEAVMPLENNTGWIGGLAQSLLNRIVGLTSGGTSEKVSLQQSVKKVSLTQTTSEKTRTETNTSIREKGITINKLYIPVGLTKIKDLPKFLAFLRELEDYVNANGGSVGDTATETS
ncbi:phage tail tape measure protein [Caproicibacter sp.]|uniref:phage tail tape measure protein n=1 Tax=Caproicibacter sp. TaxID=2814884 RepID=UPI00398A4248